MGADTPVPVGVFACACLCIYTPIPIVSSRVASDTHIPIGVSRGLIQRRLLARQRGL